MAKAPKGFGYQRVGDDVVITHHGHQATILRGAVAVRFLSDVEVRDPQELMARVTGNYNHGNERTAKEHSRNQGK